MASDTGEAAPAAQAPNGGQPAAARFAPPPKPAPAPPCEDCGVPLTDRVLGAFGIGFGLLILAIGFDLATGGVLARALGFGGERGNGGA